MRIIYIALVLLVQKNLAAGQTEYSRHYVDPNSSDFGILSRYMQTRERNFDTSVAITYSDLIDSATFDQQGIFRFESARFPSKGVYLCYREGHKLVILKSTKISVLQKKTRKYLMRHHYSESQIAAFLTKFAEFYSDYVFIKNEKGPRL